MNKRVLVVGSAEQSGGGVSSVIKLMKKMPVWEKYHCYWLGTQIQRNYLWKLWYAVKGNLIAFFILWRYDIVHFHTVPDQSMTVQLPILLMAKALHRKVILHIHCGNQLGMDMCTTNCIAHWCMGNADVIVLLAYKFYTLLDEYWPEAKCPRKVVYNACEYVDSLPYSQHEKTILFAGIFNKNKSADVLIEAFANVHKEFPEWRLQLLGNGPDEGRYRQMITEYGLKEHVEMPGYVLGKDKEKYFKKAGIYVMCSIYEGFPMVVMESWENGVPVITTPVGGLPDVIEEGRNAFVFDFGQVCQLTDKLRMLMGNYELRKSMSIYGKKFVENNFSMEVINTSWEFLYKEI